MWDLIVIAPFLLFQHAYRDGRLEESSLRHLGAEDGNTVIAKDIRSAIAFVPFYHFLFLFNCIIWLQLHSFACIFHLQISGGSRLSDFLSRLRL